METNFNASLLRRLPVLGKMLRSLQPLLGCSKKHASMRKTGQYYENIAQKYLIRRGFKFVTKNYACRFGELDIIMLDRDILVFVEVRYRSGDYYGGALASITEQKKRRIITSANCFLRQNLRYSECECRFDVVAISSKAEKKKILWVKSAFITN